MSLSRSSVGVRLCGGVSPRETSLKTLWGSRSHSALKTFATSECSIQRLLNSLRVGAPGTLIPSMEAAYGYRPASSSKAAARAVLTSRSSR